MPRPHPGTLEIEWLGDLKPLAEEIGAQVFGEPVDWRVESSLSGSPDRPDVVVEKRSDRVAVFSGEAKRPDAPEGAHPLIDGEVAGAVSKAQSKGVWFCFTTNFHQIAVMDARAGLADPVTRLQKLIPFIPEQLAKANNWWRDLNDDERRAAAAPGLRELFEVVFALQAGLSVSKNIDVAVISFLTRMTDALVDPLSQTFLSGTASAEPKLKAQALAAGLNLNEHQHCRYFVAQGVVEVLSAALFYEVLRSYFEPIGKLLGETSPALGPALEKTVTDSLTEAEAVSGDYEPILRLSSGARWVLMSAPPPAVTNWLVLFSFLEQLDMSSIEGDVLGTIFERLISPERRRQLGQHYTQPRIARSMAKWGVRSPEDRVLDPACGAGTFLVETRARHTCLGASHDESLNRTFGNDLDGFATHLAAINLAAKRIRKGSAHPIVRQGDAFDLRRGIPLLSVHTARGDTVAKNLDKIDLVITNPPFAMKHPAEEVAQRDLVELFGTSEAVALPRMHGANLAAWFVLLGAGMPPGFVRMAYVLPVAVWQNENLRSWRTWVRERYDLTIWHTEEDIWFSDARVAVCVVLFETIQIPKSGASGSLDFVQILEKVEGDLTNIDGVDSPTREAKLRSLDVIPLDGDPIIAGTKPDVLLKFEKCPAVKQLNSVAGCSVTSGEKLGHAFFKVIDQNPGAPGVMRSVRGLGTTFRVSSNYLTPLLTSPKELLTGNVETQSGYLLTLPKNRPSAQGIRSYLRVGEASEVHLAPSVAARGSSWWHIDPEDGDVAIPTHSQFTNEVAWFQERGVANNNFHKLRFEDREAAEIVAASLASAFGALNRLYCSCEIGCEGARHTLLPHLKSWAVLDPARVGSTEKAQVLDAYRAFRALPPEEIDHLSEATGAAWAKLTRAVAVAALTGSSRDTTQLVEAAVSEAISCVAVRRRRETLALLGRTRAAGQAGERLSNRVARHLESSADYARARELLTSGDDVITVRNLAETLQGSIFDAGGSMLELHAADEERLSRLVGGGFRCAPPHPEVDHALFNELVTTLERLFEDVVTEFNGIAPQSSGSGTDDAALATWTEISSEIRELVLRRLRRDVQSDLVG